VDVDAQMEDREEDFLGFCAEKIDSPKTADPVPTSPKKGPKGKKKTTESMSLAYLGGENEEMKAGPLPEAKFMTPE